MMNKIYKNIILTGELQVGKSTIIDKYIEYLKNNNISFGGFRTFSIEEGDEYNVYIVPATADIKIDKSQIKHRLIYSDYKLSNENKIGERNNKIFYKSIFDNVGLEILSSDIKNKNVIIFDEIGHIEETTNLFLPKIKSLLYDKNKKIVAIFRKHGNKLLEQLKTDNNSLIIEVTIENRDDIMNKYLI